MDASPLQPINIAINLGILCNVLGSLFVAANTSVSLNCPTKLPEGEIERWGWPGYFGSSLLLPVLAAVVVEDFFDEKSRQCILPPFANFLPHCRLQCPVFLAFAGDPFSLILSSLTRCHHEVLSVFIKPRSEHVQLYSNCVQAIPDLTTCVPKNSNTIQQEQHVF